MSDLIDITEASAIIGVTSVTARKLLGDPVIVEKNKYNLPRYLYLRASAEKAAKERRKLKSPCEVCRRCHVSHHKCEIVGGRCLQCRADLCVLNFCGVTCCPCQEADPKFILCLKRAIERAEARHEK